MTMTYDAAVDCIHYIMAAWPQAEKMSNETAQLWVDDLRPLDLDIAAKALDRLRHQLNYPPSTHQFLDAYRGLTPRPEHHAELAPPKRLGPNTAIARALRVKLREAKPESMHTNHNLDPAKDCPVCSLHDHAIDGRHVESCRRCHAFGVTIFEAVHRPKDPNTPETP